MPTDHACHAAAQAAAQGIAPVRALLAPVRPAAPLRQEPVIPVALRQYYGIVEDESVVQPPPQPAPEPVSTARGSIVLLTLLGGLRAEVNGTLLDWYVRLPVEVPHAVGAPAAAAPELQPPSPPGTWQALTDLKTGVEDLLTLIVDRRRGEHRAGELNWRLALVEDAFAGALRRLDVPLDTSVQCAADVAGPVGSLFGIRY